MGRGPRRGSGAKSLGQDMRESFGVPAGEGRSCARLRYAAALTRRGGLAFGQIL